MTPIDLRSDTVTRPTAAMRAAIAAAPVGDDVYGEDPTVARLEAVAAERLAMGAAVFVPSGTMANQIAIKLHTRPGDAMLCEAGAHPFHYEAGGPAWLSGVMVHTEKAHERGILNAGQVAGAFRPVDAHYAPLTLVSIEDTANRGGGTVHPLPVLVELGAAARQGGAAVHLDGARFWNAVVASGDDAAARAAPFDTVSMCLSKGLGAPVGSLLLLRDPTEEAHARRIRKGLGGGMRQAGILAAAGLYALTHHVERIADDHARAQGLAEGLRRAGYTVDPVETNMVFVDVGDAAVAVEQLGEAGIKVGAAGEGRLRLVTHLDINDQAIELAVRSFDVLAESLIT